MLFERIVKSNEKLSEKNATVQVFSVLGVHIWAMVKKGRGEALFSISAFLDRKMYTHKRPEN